MSYAASNPIVGANNRSKRAEIPVSVVGSATANNIVISVDDPYVGQAESVDSGTGVADGSAVNTLDTSCNLTGLKKDGTGSALVIGFVVLDGGTDLPSSSVPSAGYSATATPSLATAVKGSARYLRAAKLIVTDGIAGCPTGTIFTALRASLGAAGVTSNGNLQVKLSAPVATLAAAGAVSVATTLTVAATMKGILELVWD
jgi:hypothetical protein